MKTIYTAGEYYIKMKGRGIQRVTLSKSQAKALFELCRKSILEIESIELITNHN